MVNNLTTHFLSRIPQCKLLIIGGDFFDSLLSLSKPESNLMISFIIDLLQQADRYEVIVRVLKGTFTHDRDQCHLFQVLHEKGGFTNDFRYVDTLCLEYIEALDLKCLWVPDDLPFPSSDAIMEQVHQKLHDMNWDAVDHVFLHGAFEHVMPPDMPKLPAVTFRARQFAGIVTRSILCGHIHTSSAYTETFPEGDVHVYYGGSVERLAHGEEEPKGFLFVKSAPGTSTVEFVENTDATKFLTFDLSKYEQTELAVQKYTRLVEKHFKPNEYGYVRVVHGSTQVRNVLRKVTQTQYPTLTFSHKASQAAKATAKIQTLITKQDYPTPTVENLPGMLSDFLRTRLGATEEQVAGCLGVVSTLFD